MSKATFQAGLAAGIVSGMRFPMVVEPKKEANWYVYGGIELPPLPEWDKETYPYAMIVTGSATGSSSDGYRLYVADQPAFYRRKDDLTAVCLSASCRIGNSSIVYQNHPSLDGAEWGVPYFFNRPIGPSNWYAYASSYVWANFDVLWDDGTLSLPASAPVPALSGNWAYGGVRLPKLPVVEGYPYSLISDRNGFYSAYCFDVEPAVANVANLTLIPYSGTGTYTMALCSSPFDKFNDFTAPSSFIGLLAAVAEGIIWTNFDLRYKGTNDVYSKASEPIPVYK